MRQAPTNPAIAASRPQAEVMRSRFIACAGSVANIAPFRSAMATRSNALRHVASSVECTQRYVEWTPCCRSQALRQRGLGAATVEADLTAHTRTRMIALRPRL